MDFSLTDEQQLLLDSFQELLDRECSESYIAELDRTHQPATAFNKALSEAGFSSLGFPEEYGGTPADALTLVLLAEKAAHQGLTNGFGGALLQVRDILMFGSEEQKKTVLALYQAGESPFSLCITEPGAGSDDAGMTTTATRADGKVIINGSKTFITGAQEAKYGLVLTRDLENPHPHRAMSMWLIPMDLPGITIHPLEKFAWNNEEFNEVFFDHVEVDPSTLVGEENNGFLQLMKNFEFERVVIAASVLGQAQAAFEDAARHAATRKQFGQPIGDFQLIQLKLTNMAVKLENIRNLVYKSAWMIDAGQPLKTMASMTKLYATQAGFEIADDALQIFGGIGVTADARISRLWRDMRLNRIGGGTDEMMIHTVGRQIVKDFG
jgi:alkylation response protein AidB-like acyl-CoA dehydrogenase